LKFAAVDILEYANINEFIQNSDIERLFSQKSMNSITLISRVRYILKEAINKYMEVVLKMR